VQDILTLEVWQTPGGDITGYLRLKTRDPPSELGMRLGGATHLWRTLKDAPLALLFFLFTYASQFPLVMMVAVVRIVHNCIPPHDVPYWHWPEEI
jgi:hypothetical protein